ncbi:MAG: hypothetical protein HY321_02650 [Armatimonadetes bacterium]|nr:hypothetical protein [Armatimonadota bacterium]
MDVINANRDAAVWAFSVDGLYAAGINDPDTTCLTAVVQGYEGLGAQARQIDVIVLTGVIDDDGAPPHSAVGVVGLPPHTGRRDAASAFLWTMESRFRSVPGHRQPCVRWLGNLALVPRVHFEHGKVIRYDNDDSYSPDDTQRDTPDWYGTSLTFSFAKAVVDPAWVYRSQLRRLKDGGYFKHVPIRQQGSGAAGASPEPNVGEGAQ